MRPRARTASGWPLSRSATPRLPRAAIAIARACVGGAAPRSTRRSVRRSTGDGREAQVRRSRQDRRQERRRVIGAQDDARARARLLEGLEERVLGIGVHPLCGAHDRHAVAAFHRQQRQCHRELADPARCGSDRRRPPAQGGARRDGRRPRPCDTPRSRGRAARTDRPRGRAARPRGRARASSCRPHAGPREGARAGVGPRR